MTGRVVACKDDAATEWVAGPPAPALLPKAWAMPA
jgi:hypothetical protein